MAKKTRITTSINFGRSSETPAGNFAQFLFTSILNSRGSRGGIMKGQPGARGRFHIRQNDENSYRKPSFENKTKQNKPVKLITGRNTVDYNPNYDPAGKKYI